MYKILAYEGILKPCLDGLKRLGDVTSNPLQDEETLCRLVAGKDILVVRSKVHVTKRAIEAAKSLKYLGRIGVGIDNIDPDAQALCKERGIKIITTPGATTESVAEMTLALALALFRNIPLAHTSVKAGRWEKKRFVGNELIGRKWGILGFGRIGHTVAKLAAAFDCILYMYDPLVDVDVARAHGTQKIEDLHEFLSNCEILSIHVPLLPQTHHLIDAKAISKMPKGARLINISRGPVVDEKALVKALTSGHLAGAALDVYEHEPPTGSQLLKLDNVVLTCHLGGSTHEGQARASEMLVDLLKEELKKR